MPSCYVPGCKSGYDRHSNEKRHFFTPPKDPTLFFKWSKAIPRHDLPLSDKSRICDLHFTAEFIQKCDRFVINGEKVEIPRQRCKLDPSAVPHIFPNLPKYLSRNIVVRRSPYKRQFTKSVVPSPHGCSLLDSPVRSSAGCKSKVTGDNQRELILKKRIKYLQRKVTLVSRRLKEEKKQNAELRRELEEIKSSSKKQSQRKNKNTLHFMEKCSSASSEEKTHLFTLKTSLIMCTISGSTLLPQHCLNTSYLYEMDLKVDIKEEPVWPAETADTPLNSELNNGVDNEHSVKIEPRTPFITAGNALDSRTEDDTAVGLKEETWVEEKNLGEAQLYDDGTSLLSNTARDAVAEPEKIFFKEEVSDSVDLCDVSRSSPSQFLTPTGRKIFPCSVCSKTYRRKIYLERHALVHCKHSDTKVVSSPFVCVFCNKTYVRRPDYLEHVEMHSGVKKHECKVCKKKFGWRQSLRKHMIIHPDNPNKNPFACKVCPKSFIRPHDLHKHVLVHLSKDSPTKVVPSRSYVCNICNKALKGRSHLKDHLGMHEGVMSHECSVCSRKFKWRQCLRMHMMIHTESRPFPCKVCSRAFRRRSDLRRHSLTHMAERESMHEKNIL